MAIIECVSGGSHKWVNQKFIPHRKFIEVDKSTFLSPRFKRVCVNCGKILYSSRDMFPESK